MSVGTKQTLDAASRAARTGAKADARRLLLGLIAQQPDDHRAWLWLAFVADTVEEKRGALRRALELRRDDSRIRAAFMELMEPRYVRASAAQGVFLSYARGDELLAIELADALRAAHVPVWLDTTDIPDDADWNTEVRHALERCGVMVTILSPEAVEDAAVQAERRTFVESGKIIVPLLYRHCEHEHLLLWHPVIDFRQDLRLGTATLIRLLSGS